MNKSLDNKLNIYDIPDNLFEHYNKNQKEMKMLFIKIRQIFNGNK
jgi:hypothetical protein